MAEARIQRKLAAILVADVVGYSRLIGTDETGTIKALNALRSELFEPKAAQHHGRTVKLMGDGELMEFPSIVDAVRFAVEVQCALSDRNASIPEDQRIAFRMGVNVGDVVVEGDDLYGDGVNIAARLEALAEPGGVCLSRSARDQVRDRLDIDLTDMGEIDAKNISRKMRVFAVVMNDKARSLMSPVQAASTTDLSTPPHRKTSEHRTWAWTVGGLAVLAALVAGLWFWRLPDADSTRSSEPLAPASVAVLPFSNMSADPQKVYFSNGVTEGIMLELSRMPSMFVPASNSTKRYAGAGVGLKEIGKELGVRYVLDGSVQQADGQVRITAKLMEIESGKQVWAKRYDRPLQDVFAVQDEISTSIAALLVAQIEQADLQIAKRKPTSDMDAYDLVLQGRELVNLGTTLERDSRAKTLYERAIALDPDFAEAYAGLSEVYTRNFIFDRGDVTGNWRSTRRLNLASAVWKSILRTPMVPLPLP